MTDSAMPPKRVEISDETVAEAMRLARRDATIGIEDDDLETVTTMEGRADGIFQNEDGTVVIPEVLRPLCGFDRISPAGK